MFSGTETINEEKKRLDFEENLTLFTMAYLKKEKNKH